MITPLCGRDALDVPGLDRLIEHILAGGVQGLFILGSSGEGPSLNHRLRRELIERVCRQVAARVPVLVGITDTSLVESLEVAECAAQAGASAVVLAPPYYYPLAQHELVQYVRDVARDVALPILLYNIPPNTKVGYELETIRALLDMPEVIGIKDSSGKMVYFHHLCQIAARRPDFTLLVGPEMLLAECVLLGGHGSVSGGANIWPELYVGLYQAAAAGDAARAAALHNKVMKHRSTLFTICSDPSGPLRTIKCALACLGICDDWMSEPLKRLNSEERERVRAYLRDEAGTHDEAQTPCREASPSATPR